MEKTRIASLDLETIAWGLLLIWWGLRWWPLYSLPNGSGLLGTGIILLGLNAVRALNGIPTRKNTTINGILAVAFGGLLIVLEMMGVQFDIALFEASLIALGVYLVIRAFQRSPS